MNNTSQTHASIEEVVSLLKQKAAKDEEYNQKLNDSISQQSKILEDFINKFVVRMEEIFTKMQGNIEQQIQDFGEDQFKKTSAILTEITQKLSDSSTALIAKQEQSVTEMIDRTNEGLSSVTTTVVQQVDKLCADTTSALQDISAKQREDFSGIIEKYGDLAQRLTQQGADGLQQMEELKQTYQSANASMLQSATDMNNEITAGFRSSISTLIADMQALIRQQVESLSAAITNSVQTLQQSYDYIDNHVAHIKGNYDSSAQSFEDAMKLAHRHNETSDKLVKTFNESIGAVVETNEKIDNVLSVLVERQENIESLIVKINQIGETIELLQKLELQLNRIASK
jgi:ABC-type transporter Mla subunit MlaD